MPRLTLLLVTLLLPTQLGCIWDRDTLASEIAGRQNAVKVIAGWFDRYPPQYYLMRLERVTADLEKDPTKLDLYDDAAVASDRLGDPDAAIAWMEQKQAHLHREPTDAPQPNHRYRTLANLGTFHAHRWVKARLAAPAEASPLDDLRTAEQLIAQAIRENPDAHFGRETYQLMLIQWLLAEEPGKEPFVNPLAELAMRVHPATSDRGYLAELQIADAVDGLTGMIELGAAWESIDLFRFMAAALQAEGRSQPAECVQLRLAELESAGRTSIHPNQDAWHNFGWHKILEDPVPTQTYYTQITEAADQRHQSRTAYLLARLDRGEHPDTHPNFWNEWKEPAFPEPAHSQKLSIDILNGGPTTIAIVCLTLLILLVAYKVLSFIRARLTATP